MPNKGPKNAFLKNLSVLWRPSTSKQLSSHDTTDMDARSGPCYELLKRSQSRRITARVDVAICVEDVLAHSSTSVKLQSGQRPNSSLHFGPEGDQIQSLLDGLALGGGLQD